MAATTPSMPRRSIRGPRLLAARLAVVTFALALPGSAQAAAFEPFLPCYLGGIDQITLTVSGFPPGATIDFQTFGNTFATATADSSGRASTVQKAPRHPFSPTSITPLGIGVAAVERGNEDNRATGEFTISNVAGKASGEGPRKRHPFRLWTFKGIGFFAVTPEFVMLPIYMHFVYDGDVRKTVRIGTGERPCGSFKKTFRKGWPLDVVRKGTWRLALQTRKRYRKRNFGVAFEIPIQRTYRR